MLHFLLIFKIPIKAEQTYIPFIYIECMIIYTVSGFMTNTQILTIKFIWMFLFE